MSKQTDLINIPDAITVSGSNVGIGTTSPSKKLEVNGYGKFTSSDNSPRLHLTGGRDYMLTTTASGLFGLYDNTASSYRLAVDSSGNVGIGTSSINSSDKLSVVGGKIRASQSIAQSGNSLDNATYSGITINNSNDANGDLAGIAMYPTSQYTAAAGLFGVRESQTAAGLSFWTGSNTGTERMRIDSSGNLLVGTTSDLPAITNVQGIALSSGSYGGRLEASRSGGAPVCFNRLENGSIVEIKKAGVTSGIIGAVGTQSYIHGGGTDVGIYFGSNNLYPYRQAGLNDATIDLGQSSKRFKDAYLSGGVYLGGTGSANKLEDYEEGTSSPEIVGGFFNMGSGTTGSYTKVGNIVNFQAKLVFPSTSNTSEAKITLPFVVSDRTNYYPTGKNSANGNTSASLCLGIIGQSYIVFQNDSGSTAATVANLSNANLNVNITYQTSA
jgi:hypothetical protein